MEMTFDFLDIGKNEDFNDDSSSHILEKYLPFGSNTQIFILVKRCYKKPYA